MKNFLKLFVPQTQTEAQCRQLGTIIGVGVALLIAAVLGASIRPSGIYQAPPAPVTVTVPAAEELTTGAHGAEATSCVNPGNPSGYCWYTGYRWPQNSDGRTWICIDSSIPGHPLGAVATKFRAIDPRIVISAYNGAGQCKAHGFPRNRYVTFIPFTAAERSAMPGTCGLTYAPNYGAYGMTNSVAYNRPLVKIHVNGTKRTPCGAEPEWTDVFAHELGHTFGLSHGQPLTTSIMRQGHSLDAYDKCYIRIIHRAYGPGCRWMNIP